MPVNLRAILVIIGIFLTAPAAAQSCNFGISGPSFGSVDPLSSSPVDVTATLSINCSGVPLTTVRICPSIGAGSGGATAATRQMISGASTLNYNLYQDAARTTIWGSYNWAYPPTPPTIDLQLNLGGNGSRSVPIYARVFGSQSSALPGSYSSSFAGAETDFIYGILGVLPCPNIIVLPQHGNPTLTASADIANNCSVTAQDINFGTHGTLGTNVDAKGGVTVTCTPGTNYTISLGPGQGNGSPSARKMFNGAHFITYGLYRDPTRAQPWGDTAGADTVSGTGSGVSIVLDVYGRVPPQSFSTTGVYNDTIVVTVSY
jgi:spore coat protein U-like protein